MVSGATTVQILDNNIDTISGAVAALRVGVNDKYNICTIANGMQVVLTHIAES